MQLTEQQLRRLVQEQVNKQIIKEAFELTKGGELAIKAAMKVLFFPIKFIPYIGMPLYVGLTWAVEKILIVISTFMLGRLSEEKMITRIQNLMFVTVDKVVNLDSKFAGKMRAGLDAFVAGLRLKYPQLNEIYEDDFGEDGDKMVFALWLTSRIINVISHKKFSFIKFDRKKLPIDFKIIEGLGRIPAEAEIKAARERLKQAGFTAEDIEEFTQEVETIDITPFTDQQYLLPQLSNPRPENFDDVIIPSYEDDEEESWEDDIELMSIDDNDDDDITDLMNIPRRPLKESIKLQRILSKVFAD